MGQPMMALMRGTNAAFYPKGLLNLGKVCTVDQTPDLAKEASCQMAGRFLRLL